MSSRVEMRNHQQKPTGELIKQAQVQAKLHGKRLTPIREHIYIKLLREGPLSAYGLLEKLEGVASKAPPTVYRALEFLESINLIFKLRGVSKYVALPDGAPKEPLGYVVCRRCGSSKPIKLELGASNPFASAAAVGFSHMDPIIELNGLCEDHSAGCNRTR